MEASPAVHAAALWAGLSLALLVVLSVRVTRLRRRHEVALGHGDIPSLHHAVRAFGNAAEYVPAGLAGLGILALLGAPALLVHLAGLVLFAGRVSHAVGVSRSGEPSRARAAGALATWIAYVMMTAALIFYAVP